MSSLGIKWVVEVNNPIRLSWRSPWWWPGDPGWLVASEADGMGRIRVPTPWRMEGQANFLSLEFRNCLTVVFRSETREEPQAVMTRSASGKKL